MRIDGEWVRFADGEYLPVVRGQVIALDGTPVETLFLIDTGADRTVLTSDVFEQLGLESIETDERIVGVGGRVNSVQVATQIWMRREGGLRASFNAPSGP
jgi:predicted aspartyl protease